VIKINMDGAVRLDQGVAGGGGVAGDSQGFRGAWCRLYQGISDPLCIEALAVRDAVVFASQQGFCRLVIETDCQELVKLWKERQVGLLLLLLLVRLKIFYFF
jgi:ribonuclease HI